jgi:hypothetical protein
LEDSGWQWIGRWGTFLGTPIHPKYFLTAAHVGGRVGDPFVYRGETYRTSASTNIAGSDLRLWRICGEFPDYAPLHTNRNLVGRDLVWYGRGTRRGAAVTVTNGTLVEVRGWLWGVGDQVVRWGENRVEEVVEDAPLGPFLRATFDADAGPNECHLSTGDSGGAAFVLEGTRWELAGVHYSVDGPYSRVATGPGFNAALFDHSDFYWQDGTNWTATTEYGQPGAGGLYTTDVSAHAEEILAILAQPIVPDDAPVVQRSAAVHGPFIDIGGQLGDTQPPSVRIPSSHLPGYLRLRSCMPTRIVSVTLNDDELVLVYVPE